MRYIGTIIGCFLLLSMLPFILQEPENKTETPQTICEIVEVPRVHDSRYDIASVCINHAGWHIKARFISDDKYEKHVLPVINSVREKAIEAGIYDESFDLSIQ